MSEEIERDEKQAGVTPDVTPAVENPPAGVAEKRRAGGQPGNTNSAKHGARSRRPDLALGDWGKQFGNLRQQALKYRRRLMSEVAKAHGSVSLINEERVAAAVAIEMSRRILQRELTRDGITATERLSIIQKIVNFACQRLQIVQRLKLEDSDGDQPGGDPWAFIDAQRAAQRARVGVRGVQDDSGIGPTHSNAGDATADPLPGKSIGSE